MGEHEVERSRHLGEVEGLDQQGSEPALAAAFAPEEAAELGLAVTSPPRRLVLQRAQRRELILGFDDPLNTIDAECADELFLQVGLAGVETEAFQVGASEVGTETRPFERAYEVALFARIVETCQPNVEAIGAVHLEEAPDVGGTAHRHD